jgi:hypothetical protein
MIITSFLIVGEVLTEFRSVDSGSSVCALPTTSTPSSVLDRTATYMPIVGLEFIRNERLYVPSRDRLQIGTFKGKDTIRTTRSRGH